MNEPQGTGQPNAWRLRRLMRARRVPSTLAFVILFGCANFSTAPAQESSKESASASEASRWIEELGHPSFATRLRARQQLQRMGLQALDELQAAQSHLDREIAMSARHLVTSLLISWSTESDPQPVRDALDEYGAQSETERQNRMDRLAELPDRQGLAALCRLARFEPSLRLSREAALVIMRYPTAEDEATRIREANTIRDVIGPNNRQAADWLRAYADDLSEGDYSAERWREIVRQQRQSMDEGSDPNSNRPAVLELVQVCASRAAAAGNRDEALSLSIEHLDLIPPRAREVIDACSWAIDNQMHSIVLELNKRHLELFGRQPILLYGAAEALLAEGDNEKAEEYARNALMVDPLPGDDSDAASKLSPKVIEENAQRHREVGRELESRGLFRWAEREYRHIIESLAEDSPISAIAKSQLCTMLIDLNRHDDCIAILKPMIQRADEDQQFARRLASASISIIMLKRTLAFQQGLSDLAKKDFEAARTSLPKALELDEGNADILIAMYRTEGDEKWKAKVRGLIEELARTFELEILSRKTQAKPLMRQLDGGAYLAEYLNQYAWLISNTEGDYKKALEYSLQSLELTPGVAAQLDTAGRCYYAVGDLENAVRMQKRAVKLMPHSPPLIRQMEMFESALAEQNAAEGSRGDKS